jgi:hypothetical protein
MILLFMGEEINYTAKRKTGLLGKDLYEYRKIITLFIILIAFVFPILGMFNCQTRCSNPCFGIMWTRTVCFVNSPFLETYSDFFYFILFLSTELFYLPMVIYVVFFILLIKRINKKPVVKKYS